MCFALHINNEHESLLDPSKRWHDLIDTRDTLLYSLTLISPFHILYKVVDHDKKTHAPRCGISLLLSASACVLLLELQSYAHDAMLERRNKFIMFSHLECLLLRRVFTISLLGDLEALLHKMSAICFVKP